MARLVVPLLATTLALAHLPESTRAGQRRDTPPIDVGRVAIQNSCAPAARPHLERGVALLHALWHEAAHAAFTTAAREDEECALAYWGQAMSAMPTLVDLESEWSFGRGSEAVRRARQLRLQTPRERAYLQTVYAFFEGPAVRLERRLYQHSEATAALARAYPNDQEATVFYARALLALRAGGEYENQRQAARALIGRFGAMPAHPGAAHYLVYAYDNAVDASRGLSAADHYARMAPVVPRAQHIASHIHARLGQFVDVAARNEAAWRTWFSLPIGIRAGDIFQTSTRYAYHSLLWLVYARAQMGQFADAAGLAAAGRDAAARLPFIQPAVDEIDLRYALERGAWSDVLGLDRAPAARDNDDQFWYARGIAAARAASPGAERGAVALAREAVRRLEAIERRAPSVFVELERTLVLAAIAAALEEQGEMTVLLAHAIALENSVGQRPALPRLLLPAREVAGDLWLQVRQYDAAVREFQAALESYPGRARSLLGLARAASRAGDDQAARLAARRVLDAWRAADASRPELAEMRAIADR